MTITMKSHTTPAEAALLAATLPCWQKPVDDRRFGNGQSLAGRRAR
jgi:hypothetical protein